MNNKTARFLLDIKNDEKITHEILKRQFRYKALEYHPDKNNSADAKDRFMEVKDAYDTLKENMGDETSEINCDYADLLYDFMRDTLNMEEIANKLVNTRIFNLILEKMSHSCETKMMSIIEKIDKSIIIELYKVITNNDTLFKYIDNSIIENIKSFIDKKTKDDERIILNPTIEDLLECNVYKFNKNGNRFIIPLWHDELIYDISGSDLYVLCNPILDDNYFIDEYKNLHIKITHKMKDIWCCSNKKIKIGNKVLEYIPSELKLKYYQSITFKGNGLPYPNSKDIFNIKRKGDIVLHIYIDYNNEL